MNQYLCSIFSVQVNDKVFQLTTGMASFDEVQQALDQFKSDFVQFKADQEKRMAEEQAAKNAEAPVVVEPEVI